MCLRYFGSADVDYYGLHPRKIFDLRPGDRILTAVSVTHLHTESHRLYPWIWNCTSVARIGYTINVYDVAAGACQVR